MPLDVVDGVLNRADLLGVFVRDVDLERLFEGKDELDQPKRIRAQIVDEARFWLDVFFVDVELLFDDPFDLGRDVGRHG